MGVIEIAQLRASWQARENYLLLFFENKVHPKCKSREGEGGNQYIFKGLTVREGGLAGSPGRTGRPVSKPHPSRSDTRSDQVSSGPAKNFRSLLRVWPGSRARSARQPPGHLAWERAVWGGMCAGKRPEGALAPHPHQRDPLCRSEPETSLRAADSSPVKPQFSSGAANHHPRPRVTRPPQALLPSKARGFTGYKLKS